MSFRGKTLVGTGGSGDKVLRMLVILCKLYYNNVLGKKAKQYFVNSELHDRTSVIKNDDITAALGGE